jgi:hypothetical protein
MGQGGSFRGRFGDDGLRSSDVETKRSMDLMAIEYQWPVDITNHVKKER